MDNLHRALAPVSASAWAQIEEEAARTLRRYMGARRVVDVQGPHGYDFSAVNLGHRNKIASPFEGVEAAQRRIGPVIELRVPFQLAREDIDDVERGAQDADWQPVKDAARRLAHAEDSLVFEGYTSAGITGLRGASSNAPVPLPASLDDYPEAVSQALDALRVAGVQGPYALVLGDDAYTQIAGGADHGYPLLKHIRNLVEREVIWSPALKGGLVLSLRGGDFDLYLGQDASIGYLSHGADSVTLYLQETAYFQVQTTEAVVSLPAP